MNIVTLTGRLTKEPDLKYGQSGNAYLRFSIAVNRPRKRDEVDFINCVAFGKTAEAVASYVKKGHRVGLNGALHMNKYESNGEKRTTYEVSVNEIEFLENKKQELGDFQQSVVNEFS